MAKQPVKYFVADAFTDLAFKGNPAAVCLLEEERDEKWLQAVATEFNLSETCYLTRISDSESPDSSRGTQNPRFRLRWFTPTAEIDLCGHATLAAAHVLFTSGLVNTNKIEFSTLSGILTAQKVPEIKKPDINCLDAEAQQQFFIELDFPTVMVVECDSVEVSSVHKALKGASVIDIKKTGNNLLVELSSAKTVADFQPEFDEIEKCPGQGLIITGLAPAHSGFDFVSRYFCPKYGVKEDPVTGSTHCALAPYWSKNLGKCDFVAYQASPRGGTLRLHLDEQKQRVLLRGKAVPVMEGLLLA
ncbi:uncharacterized protein LOC131155385 [Malania oleifera]|uniref:uncharacterized protein LOC131155385 n=1 Tax=Malania oleifera TaxID=397392 RepID=UPI0025AE17AA|nr:uncharacterized protein LOC131155385 [Malania oleifera]